MLRSRQDTAQINFASFDFGSLRGLSVGYLSIGYKLGGFQGYRLAVLCDGTKNQRHFKTLDTRFLAYLAGLLQHHAYLEKIRRCLP